MKTAFLNTLTILILVIFSLNTSASSNCHSVLGVDDSLLFQKIIKIKPLGKGLSKPLLVTFQDKSQAVFKPDSTSNRPGRFFPSKSSASDAEIAAYQFSEFLELGFVLKTVKRAVYHQGKYEEGSLQVYKNLWDANWPRLWHRAKKSDLLFMEVFDFLISNQDRTKPNYLIGKFGRIYLIDHGLAFPGFFRRNKLSLRAIKFLTTNHLAQNFLRKISSFDENTLLNAVPELNVEQIREILFRRDLILDQINSY